MLIYMDKKVIKQPFILIFYGPTGVGKTNIALSIAARIPSEIINMDVGQFYTPLSIGTAKPDWENEPVTHHLFDIIDSPRNYTVVEYRTSLQNKIREIVERGNLPIIVGGSSFYLHSLFFPPSLHIPENSQSSIPFDDYSWDALYAIDPQRAMSIDKNDPYRIMRALDIWNKTGKIPTSTTPEYDPIADFSLIYVIRDTQELNKRINDRISV